jgi:very-short-patch-repair endonuclease
VYNFIGRRRLATTLSIYAPAAKLVIEVDGGHHLVLSQAEYDRQRSEYLQQRGLRVLRFDDRQVLLQIESVVQAILQAMKNPS